MTTYNGAQFLSEQLASLACQSRLPDELVVCDDGSEDGTVAMLRRFSAHAPFPVRLLENDNRLGCAKNFEQALHKCVGDVIFLCDQDDIWYSHKIRAVARKFEMEDALMVIISDAEILDAAGNTVGLTKARQTMSAGLPRTSFVTGCCTAVRRTFLKIALPIPTAITHDYWINSVAVALRRRAFLPQILQGYRRHGCNLSQSITSKMTKATALDQILHDWRNRNNADEIASAEQTLCSLENRVHSKRETLISGFGFTRGDVDEILGELMRRREVGLRRSETRRCARYKRIGPIIKLAIDGGYSGRGGWRGILRDALF